MYAQLGSIVFDNAKTPTAFAEKGEAQYAEHEKISSKNKLEATGQTLEEISLSVRFHVSFCNPAEEYAALKTARNTFEVLPLIWGNGSYKGSYVITAIDATHEDADPQGNVFSMLVNLTLREYVIEDRLEQEQRSNRNNARAVGKKPAAIERRRTNPPNCSGEVTAQVSAIRQHARRIDELVTRRAPGQNVFERGNLGTGLSQTDGIALALAQLATQPGHCAAAQPNITPASANVSSIAQAFLDKVKANQSILFPTYNTQLQHAVRQLEAAARKLTNQTITRQ